MTQSDCPALARFLRGDVDAHQFAHREHLRMAFEMLRRHDFAESVYLYSQALRLMTSRAGRPEVFNQTVTIAFLSLVAERMHMSAPEDFAALERHHPELLDRAVLGRWYRPERLALSVARRCFLLPEPPA
jgi:hypothetical protein